MDKYAVLGNPIAHSRSPYIHTEFAKSCNQDLIYDKLLCPLDDFKKTVDTFKNSSGKGLNITVPFKEQAYNYATVLTDRANKAGAVNTLKFCDDGSIIGDNTDGAGFIWDLDRLGWSLKGKKVLLLGAGGASRGIIGPIIERLPSSVLLVNRTISKALSIKDIFPSIMVCSYDDLNDANTTFDYIVNCTSLSISGQVPPIIPASKYRWHNHEKLAHYANAASDIEFEFPFGFKELEGVHSRTDFDLNAHQKFSGKKLQYFDPESNESYVPYVVETSIGLDRTFLSVLAAAYCEEKLNDGEERVVLKF